MLNQLAALQHFGAPTRLIDVTLNAYIGLWFAVEKDDDLDGRLFAIDIISKLINDQEDLRSWEDRMDRPWGDLPDERWTRETFAWKPPPFERRISAQNGAFLFAGVPRTRPGFQLPRRSGKGQRTWPRDQVRQATSLPLRIAASIKPTIRQRLEALFGYSHRTIYPDFPGFAQYGTSLRTTPPVPSL